MLSGSVGERVAALNDPKQSCGRARSFGGNG